MKKLHLLLLLIPLFSLQCNQAQLINKTPNPKYVSIFKMIPQISENDPYWVHLMYSESPNYYKIQDEFIAYYQKNVFEKNIHTQNFKHFSRIINSRNYIKQDGSIEISLKVPEKINRRMISSNNQKSVVGWVPIGPFKTNKPSNLGNSWAYGQMNVYSLCQSISNPNILYAGGETGGIYKSSDKGLSWNSVGNNLNNRSPTAIKIDPINETVVYFGDNAGVIYKTVDGGVSWEALFSVNENSIYAIDISPNNSNIVLIAGNKGLYRTNDGGESWVKIFDNTVYDIKFKTDKSDTVFLAKKNPSKNITEILKSSDGGENFEVKDNGWYNPIGGKAKSTGGAKIGLTDADPNRLYVILLGNEDDEVDDSNFIGIYRSDNSAESWSTPYDGDMDGNPDNEPGGPYSKDHWNLTNRSRNGGSFNQGFYNLAIDVSDTNPDKFLVGALSLWKSEDGGVSYKSKGGYYCDNCSKDENSIHPDIQDIEINGDDAWVTTDGGIDYFDSNLVFVEKRRYGLNGKSYWGFDQGWNEDVLVGGSYHNGNAAYFESYGKGNFLHLGGAERATGYVNKGENRKVFHSDISAYEIPDVFTGNLKKIAGYSKYPSEHYWRGYSSEVVNDPRFWNELFLGKENKLWKSENGGSGFILLKEFGEENSHLVKGIEISRKNPNLIFVTQQTSSSPAPTNTAGKLWKSEDGGDNWTSINLPFNSNRTMLISINLENDLFLATNDGGNGSDKIFTSKDLGVSWTNLTSAVLNGVQIQGVQVQEGTEGGVYIYSSNNIWYRNNSHPDWQNFRDGLPRNFGGIYGFLPFYRDGKIRVAGGRGIWERDLFEPSKPKAQPMISKSTIYCTSDNLKKLPINFNKGLSWNSVGNKFELSKDPEDDKNNTGKIIRGTYIWDRTSIVLDEPVKIVKDGDNKYSVKVYSPDASTHKLSMVLMQSGNSEYIALTKDFTKGWNTLEFDFSTVSSQSYPRAGQFWDGTADFMKIEFRIDHGESTPGAYYHLDDIKKVNQNTEGSLKNAIIQFEDYSILNHKNATWKWEFPGASSVSSNSIRNPEVTYKSSGYYDVNLTVTNDQGTDSKKVSNMVFVSDCSLLNLPANNNKVSVTSATCIGASDGSIGLSVEDNSYDYSITITSKQDPILITGENKTVSVTGLAKGTYTVCFKVDIQANYEQCFEVVIGEPKALSAFIDVDNDKRTTNIQLGGSKSYNIEVNGQRFEVKDNNFNTVLPTGLSIIKISTDLDCQGVIEKEIFISEDIFYYPNPTRGEVDVFVNGEDKGVKMSVFTTKGDLVYTRDQNILDSRKTELDLTGVPAGTYIVTFEGATVRKIFKIVKK